MSSPSIPTSMIPVTALCGAVELLTSPEIKTDENGEVRKSARFPGLTPWFFRVEVISAYREKRLPTGEVMSLPEMRTYPVTLWTDTTPNVSAGQYVFLGDVFAGEYNGSFFLTAGAIEAAE